MAINAYRSESKTIEVILKDSAGVVIDPTLETIHDIEVILLSRYDGSVLAKYSREVKAGWTQAAASSASLLLRISPNVLNDSNKGLYEAQVNIYLPDALMTGGYSVLTYKGIVLAVTESYVE